MAEEKEKKAKVLNFRDMSICDATVQMLEVAAKDGVETAFSRAADMKACPIGADSACCKHCFMGPCRLNPKDPYSKVGVCGATIDTIAGRNFARMVASGCSAHTDHGMSMLDVFREVVNGRIHDYKIKDEEKLRSVATSVGIEVVGRETMEIAKELYEELERTYTQVEGEIPFVSRVPAKTLETWRKYGIVPRGSMREIMEIMHRTHMGVDQDYKNLVKQCTRCALGDGWGGSMLATDLQDVLFGTPYPIQAEANLGVMKEDHVNIVIHGHEPILSEMIVAAAQSKEMVDYAKTKGAKGIQLSGICCTGNEMLQRHGVPPAGTFLQQELAIITGACDAMVVDVQCIFQNLANVAKCFHTKLITTHPIAKMEQENVIHIEFDEHHAMEDAKRIVSMSIDNFTNRRVEVMIPRHKATQIAGFGVESIKYHLGGTFRGDYYTLNDNIINGRIRGIAGVVGCNNARTRHNEGHIAIVKELIKNDVIVLTTGCNGIACAMEGLLSPETAAVFCGPGLAEVCETVGIPPVLHLGSCVDNSRILLAATEVVKAGGLGKDICDLPAAGSAPEWMSEKAISIGHYFVTSGVYTVFGLHLPMSGAPVFQDYMYNELEKIYGGMWDCEADPIKHAHKMIAHIDKKRKALGIDKARERVLMDMADRQKLETA